MMNINKHKKLIIYLFFGGLNTLITYLLYVVLIKLNVQYLVASTTCYVVGIIEGFLFNAWFVFKNKPQFSSLSKYSFVYIVSYLINILLLYLLVNYINLDRLVAQLLVTAIMTIVNFKLVKLLVFK